MAGGIREKGERGRGTKIVVGQSMARGVLGFPFWMLGLLLWAWPELPSATLSPSGINYEGRWILSFLIFLFPFFIMAPVFLSSPWNLFLEGILFSWFIMHRIFMF